MKILGIGWVSGNSAGQYFERTKWSPEESMTACDEFYAASPLGPEIQGKAKWLNDKSKLFGAAATLCLRDCVFARLLPGETDDMAILSLNRDGALSENWEYYRDYVDSGREIARGNLFIHTLPTSAPAQIAMLFQLRGATLHLSSESPSAELLFSRAHALSRQSRSGLVLAMISDDEGVICFCLADEKKAKGSALPVSAFLEIVRDTQGTLGLVEKMTAATGVRPWRDERPSAREANLRDDGLDRDKVWAVIPVFNNASTVKEVAQGARNRLSHVLVVDDGSTDADLRSYLEGLDVNVIRHHHNRGKGKAILTALDYVARRGAEWMITLDGDGQHAPGDIEKFIPVMREGQDALIIGCRDFSRPNIPEKSKFGREFANFWLRVETGRKVGDCQSGFRAYPVRHFKALPFCGQHYDFETEALTRAAWAGLSLKTVEIDVWYPEAGKRVSSFRPFMDNARISWMHTRLILRHLLPLPHKKLVTRTSEGIDFSFLRHPVRFLKLLVRENASPSGLAASAAVGIILATLPLLFTHTIAILYVTARLHLNKVLAVSIQNLCNPPLVPFLCIQLGYYMQHGAWLTHLSKEAFLGEVPSLLWAWLLGSLVLAPILAAAAAFAVFLIARGLERAGQRKTAGQLKEAQV